MVNLKEMVFVFISNNNKIMPSGVVGVFFFFRSCQSPFILFFKNHKISNFHIDKISF